MNISENILATILLVACDIVYCTVISSQYIIVSDVNYGIVLKDVNLVILLL